MCVGGVSGYSERGYKRGVRGVTHRGWGCKRGMVDGGVRYEV